VQLTTCLTGLEMYVCAVQNSVHSAQRLFSVFSDMVVQRR